MNITHNAICVNLVMIVCGNTAEWTICMMHSASKSGHVTACGNYIKVIGCVECLK
jgi:hypothetical protein